MTSRRREAEPLDGGSTGEKNTTITPKDAIIRLPSLLDSADSLCSLDSNVKDVRNEYNEQPQARISKGVNAIRMIAKIFRRRAVRLRARNGAGYAHSQFPMNSEDVRSCGDSVSHSHAPCIQEYPFFWARYEASFRPKLRAIRLKGSRLRNPVIVVT